MSEPMLQAQIDAAKACEALFVPVAFGQWAARIADAVGIQSGQRVLDVACRWTSRVPAVGASRHRREAVGG